MVKVTDVVQVLRVLPQFMSARVGSSLTCEDGSGAPSGPVAPAPGARAGYDAGGSTSNRLSFGGTSRS
jgi:hypothetical protein